jgi:hypothetical protein
MADEEVDLIVSGLLDGSIQPTCPDTEKLVEDVKEGRIPVEKLKEEVAKARLMKIS